MKNYFENTTHKFIVTKKEVNNNKTLLPSVLYNKMESIAIESLSSIKENTDIKQNLFKLNLLKNAFLKDQLRIIHKIQKLNKHEILFIITVEKYTKDVTETICNAQFGYTLKNKNILELAS